MGAEEHLRWSWWTLWVARILGVARVIGITSLILSLIIISSIILLRRVRRHYSINSNPNLHIQINARLNLSLLGRSRFQDSSPRGRLGLRERQRRKGAEGHERSSHHCLLAFHRIPNKDVCQTKVESERQVRDAKLRRLDRFRRETKNEKEGRWGRLRG